MLTATRYSSKAARSNPRGRYWRIEASPGATGRRKRQLQSLRRVALERISPIVGAGLEAREGKFLLPHMVVPGTGEEMLIWELIEMQLRFLGVKPLAGTQIPQTNGLRVCHGCTNVFAPSRSDARYCPLCRKGPPRRAGDVDPQLATPFRDWPAFLGVVGRGLAKGESTTIVVPNVPGERTVVGWREVTGGRCAECADLFFKRKDATHCDACSNRVSSRAWRRERSRLTDPEQSADERIGVE